MVLNTEIQKSSFSVVIPAYNEGSTIGRVLKEMKDVLGMNVEILVVNDGSTDETGAVAGQLGVRVITHKRNFGYGASIKTGVLKAQNDKICFFDADGQHNPYDILPIINGLEVADMVIGARGVSGYQNLRRMPKFILHLTAIILTRKMIPDLNSGLRAIHRQVLLPYLHLLPDGFSASTTSTIALLAWGYKVAFHKITVKPRLGKSQVRPIADGLSTLRLIINLVVSFKPLNFFLPLGVPLLIGGLIYGFVGAIIDGSYGFPVGGMLLVFLGVMTTLAGIFMEQFSLLLKERYEDIAGIINRRIKE